MLKKIQNISACLILGMGGKIIASNSFPQGIYVGLGGGYNRTKSQFLGGETENNFGYPNQIIPDTGKKNLNSLTVTGLLGYLHIIKEYSLTVGGELFYTSPIGGGQKFRLEKDLPPALVTASLDSNFRINREYGFKVMLGYLIDNINHVYGIFGLSNKSFNEKITTTFNLPGTGEDQASISKNFSKTYFLLGMGFERAFDKIRYGIEGIYQIGNKKTSMSHKLDLHNIGAAPGLNFSIPGTRKLENSYTILFKISYSFDIFH